MNPGIRAGLIVVQVLGLVLAAFAMFSVGFVSGGDDAASRRIMTIFLAVPVVFIVCGVATSMLVARQRASTGLAVAFVPIVAFGIALWLALQVQV